MSKNAIHLSPKFRIQAVRAIITIIAFIICYLILLALAFILTGICMYLAFFLVVLKPMAITIALGIGLASLGVFIVIFLIKFIFKSHKTDRSNLIEIKAAQQPALFTMINDIVTEVGTHFPKKVYLSTDVNASVFYDSSFWSMFLPIKKNLVIGLGLVNTVTREELKAILAHEFGHFSQQTMKVGSYVYNVNQVIFNMLYDNDSYKKMMQNWANFSGYFTPFVGVAARITQGIQWILTKMYELVNKSYMALSREMEFHADEIAARVTGYEPLKKSLLRIALAENAYSNVINFYNNKITDNIKSENLYADQFAVVHFLAQVNNFPISNNLPDISLEEQSKFDKSKLVIKDQWASHPGLRDRISRLEKTGYHSSHDDQKPANELFTDIAGLQKQITQKIFEEVTYEGEVKPISADVFIEDYRNIFAKNSFPAIYNGYYDHKNPLVFDLNKYNEAGNGPDFIDLFSDEKVDWVYTAIGLQNDIGTLKNIANKSLSVKTFDYDGVRHKARDASSLTEQLQTELDALTEQIRKNDRAIYDYFLRAEARRNCPPRLKEFYHEFFSFDQAFDSKFEQYVTLSNELQFVSVTTPIEQISANLEKIKPLEENLKQEIGLLLSDELLKPEINREIWNSLDNYRSKSWEYFDGKNYINEHLQILFTAKHYYSALLSRKYLLMKRSLLVYQEQLLNN